MASKRPPVIGYLLITFTICIVDGGSSKHEPVLRWPSGDAVREYAGYAALDYPTSNVVSLKPPLKATDDDILDDPGKASMICGYHISPAHGKVDVPPFTVVVTDKFTGTGTLYTTEKAEAKVYTFDIAAYDCGSPAMHSRRIPVQVTIMKSDILTTPQGIEKHPSVLEATFKEIEKSGGHLHHGTSAYSGDDEEGDDSDGILTDEGSALLTGDKISGSKKRPGAPSTPVTMTTMTTTVSTTTSEPAVDDNDKPAFDNPGYIAQIVEGVLYNKIMSVRASGKKPNTRICSYTLLDRKVPFTIDQEGTVKNTRRLTYSQEKNFILPVVAESCAGVKSEPAFINVQVKKMCVPRWEDVRSSSAYSSESPDTFLFPRAILKTCTDTCDRPRVSAKVTIKDTGRRSQCGKDTKSIVAQQRTCGISAHTVDLLTVDGSNEGQESRLFRSEGDVLEVTSPEVNHTLGSHFTLSTWMRHTHPNTPKGTRENIICNADGEEKNRHHYSLYIRNCHLVFLLRKEANEVRDYERYRPAEWRWKIPEVCDGSWHHYAVSVDYPQVRLYVDGTRQRLDKKHLSIVDDWSLHPADSVTFTRLSVGACWHSKEKQYVQGFRGELSGMTLLKGRTESERIIKCLNLCGNKLQFTDYGLLSKGMSLFYNDGLTELTVKGGDISAMERLIHRIGFASTEAADVNTRITLATTVMCGDIRVDVTPLTVTVASTAQLDPHIALRGMTSKTRTPLEFHRGMTLYDELEILSRSRQEGPRTLDRCEASTDRPVILEEESFGLTAGGDDMGLNMVQTDHGFNLTGRQSYAAYQAVLQKMTFRSNLATLAFQSRLRPFRPITLRLVCSLGRFRSNEHRLTIDLVSINHKRPAGFPARGARPPKYSPRQGALVHEALTLAQAGASHPDSSPVLGEASVKEGRIAMVGAAAVKPALAQLKHKPVSENQQIQFEASETKDQAPLGLSAGIVVLITVCVLVVVVVGAVGAARLRRAVRSKTGGSEESTGGGGFVNDDSEMEWDNSTLNIVVNPMEEAQSLQSSLLPSAAADGSDDDDEVDDDDCDDEEDEVATVHRGLHNNDDDESGSQLDWDHSNLSY